MFSDVIVLYNGTFNVHSKDKSDQVVLSSFFSYLPIGKSDSMVAVLKTSEVKMFTRFKIIKVSRWNAFTTHSKGKAVRRMLNNVAKRLPRSFWKSQFRTLLLKNLQFIPCVDKQICLFSAHWPSQLIHNCVVWSIYVVKLEKFYNLRFYPLSSIH